MISENLVTIGIPFYNADAYFEYAIISIINQTYKNWELILLDDGSTDKSLEIANKYACKYEKIKVYSDGENRGLPTRLNELTNLAKGYYYARMDADDIMHPNRLEQQINFLESNKNVDVVGSGYYAIDENNNIIGKYNANRSLHDIQSLLTNGGFVHPSIMGKTKWFKQNPYDPLMNRMEDFELWLRTIEYSNFYNMKDALLFYRTEEKSIYKKYIKTNLNIIKLLGTKKINLSNLDKIKQQIYFMYKIIIYSFFELFKSTKLLVKRRLIPLTMEEQNIALEFMRIAFYGK